MLSKPTLNNLETALYLIPVELGETPQEQVLPDYNRTVILGIRHFIVEEVRSARRFLKRVDRDINIDALTFYPMGKHALDDARARNGRPVQASELYNSYLKPIERGECVGVISEAGCPAVADPGADIVAIAQRRGYRVIPLVGPSSMILAVMASGLNGQSFAFNGYLPIDVAERQQRLKHLEERAVREHQTQLFIETPYRNRKLFDTLMQVLRPQTRLCIAAGITTPDEWICTRTVAEWRRTANSLPDLAKIPAIFLFA